MENTTATMTVAATAASLQEPPVGLTLHPIDPDQLAQVRRDRTDAFGNTAEGFSSDGGEQLRCCLRLADVGERLWVVGHAPLTVQRPWREVGPVFVHADPCPAHEPSRDFLTTLSGAPRVLRSYTAAQAMVYAANRLTTAQDDLADVVGRIFADHPEVTEVHVRNVLHQCFVVRVTR